MQFIFLNSNSPVSCFYVKLILRSGFRYDLIIDWHNQFETDVPPHILKYK